MAPLDYANKSNIGEVTLIVGWAAASVALFTLGIVLLGRIKVVRHLGWDDLLLILAVVLAIQATWAVLNEGQGQHMQYESVSQISLVMKVSSEKEYLVLKMTNANSHFGRTRYSGASLIICFGFRSCFRS